MEKHPDLAEQGIKKEDKRPPFLLLLVTDFIQPE
jgi:hypothetical protein